MSKCCRVNKIKYEFSSDTCESGGNAVVKRAVNEAGQRYRIKEFTKLHDRTKFKKLEKQCMLWKSLKSPFIIELVDYEIHMNNALLVIEEAGDVKFWEYVKKNEKNLQKIKHIFVQICKGLLYLHEKSIAHGDLKADNVKLMDDENVKIIDIDDIKQFDKDSEEWKRARLEDIRALQVIFHQSFEKCDGLDQSYKDLDKDFVNMEVNDVIVHPYLKIQEAATL